MRAPAANDTTKNCPSSPASAGQKIHGRREFETQIIVDSIFRRPETCRRWHVGEEAQPREHHDNGHAHCQSSSHRDGTVDSPQPRGPLQNSSTFVLPRQFESFKIYTNLEKLSLETLQDLVFVTWKTSWRLLMASSKERGLPVTSPFGVTLAESMAPNRDMGAAIRRYRE